MGRVYRAYTASGKNIVAIKEMVDDRGWSDSDRANYLKAFQREVEVMSHLRVLRTVPELVEPISDWNGRRFFVMEFIEGKDLQKVLDERFGPFDAATVVKWAIQLCELLHVLHTQDPNPIVHQDLTPDNIILRQSRPSSGAEIVLLDFGVARFVRVGTKLSVYAGKNGYAPREQLVERRPEPRSDLYSLAACMHQLLTKRDPAVESGPFPPAHQLNPQVPQWLSDLIAINLSEEPRERYESAARMRDDLMNRRVTATIRCGTCGTENERSLIYCKQCAHTLLSTPRKCRNCTEFIPYNSRFCPRCGKEQ
jgi:serine/threonine protein kinase